MRDEDIYKKLFGFASSNTYYQWKKDEKRKIICFLEKYFTKNELIEYLETGQIAKQEFFIDFDLKSWVWEIEEKLEFRAKQAGIEFAYVLSALHGLKQMQKDNEGTKGTNFKYFSDIFMQNSDSLFFKELTLVDFVFIFSYISLKELNFLIKYNK